MIISILLVLVISFFTSRLFIRYILFWALSNRKLDEINSRKIHHGYVPRLGGLAFFPAMGISLLLVEFFRLYKRELDICVLNQHMPEFLTLLFSGLICYMAGVYDDLRGMGYRRKFIVQIVACLFLVAWGPRIDNLEGICGIYALHPVVSFLFSVFIAIFILNSINLIDGIDGLASGISSIAILYYGVFYIYLGYNTHALAACALLGTLIPFFIYNIWGFRKRHKIFMGDTGSLSLGIMLAFFSFSLYSELSRGDSQFSGNPLILAFAPLAVPCMDVVRTFLHRIKNHRHPFKADTSHIHHKLIFMGLSKHNTLLVLLFASATYTFFNVVFSDKEGNLVFALNIISYTLLNICLTRKMGRVSKQTKY